MSQKSDQLPTIAASRQSRSTSLVVPGVGAIAVAGAWLALGWAAALTCLVIFALAFAAMRGMSRPQTEVFDPDREMKRRLSRLQFSETLPAPHAERALSQLNDLKLRAKRFRTLLFERFQTTELAHARYSSAAERMEAAIKDNLSRIADEFESADLIQPASATETQKALRDQALGRAIGLISQNDEALTRLDSVITAVSQLKSLEARGTTEIDAMMEELEKLAERAKKYSL